MNGYIQEEEKKMKRSLVSVISWLLAIAMMVSLMPLAAFATDPDTHDHYDASTETGLTAYMEEIADKTVAGTCSHGESKTYKCSRCGYTTVAITKPIDLNAPGSNYVRVEDKCDEEKITYKCTACGDVRVCKIHVGATDTDPKHEWVEHVQSPTCSAYGYTYVTCNVDGCTVTHIKDGSYVHPSHSFNDWKVTKYATSGANGTEERTCQVCGHVETRSTNKTAPAAYTARIKYDLTPVYTENSTAGGVKFLLVKGFQFTPASTFHDSDEWCAFSDTRLGAGTFYVKTASIELNPSSVPTTTAYPGLMYVGTIKSSVPMKVRLGASTDSAELYSLPYNSTIYVYGEKTVGTDVWRKIQPKKEEWILGGDSEISLVKVIGAGSLPVEDTRDVIDTGTVVAEEGIKVRDKASTSGNQVGTIPQGTKITFYDPHVSDGKLKWGVIQNKDFAKYGLTSTLDKLYVDLSYVSLASLGGGTAGGTGVSTGTVSSSINLNVRSTPKVTPTNKVGSLANGTKVTIYETKNGWGRINQNGLSGWISLQYVVLDSGSTGGSSAEAANATIVNCSKAVNVRSAAKVTSNLVTTIPVGSRVTVTEQDGRWYHISGRGWAYGDYVKLDDGALDSGSGSGSGSGSPITTYTNVSVNAIVRASGTLNIHASANATSTVLAKLPKDTEFTIVDRTIVEKQIWAKVTFGDLVGWLKADSTTVTYPAVSGTVNASSVKIYSAPSIDSSTKGVLGSGTKVTIEADTQTVDGVYVWGKLSSVAGYVMLHQLKLDVKSTGNVDSLTVSPAITGVTTASVDMKVTPASTASTVLVLEKGASVSVSEWKYAGDTTWGKVTKGTFTGWIDMTNVKQKEVSGTVNVDMVNLYASKDATEIQQVLRSGAKVTISQRLLKDNAVWGKVLTSDGKTYWGNLAGIALAGANVPTTPTTPTNPSDSTGTGTGSGTVTTPSSGTAGTVVNTASLNVRSAAGVRNALVTTLAKGTAVTVYEQTTQDGALWGRIDQGWVAMSYIDLSSKPSNTTSSITGGSSNTIMTTVPSGAVAVGFVNYVNEVNIRSGAGQGYGKVGTLKKGANVVIYEQKLEGGMIWGRIDQGWICTSYVTMTGASITGAGTAGTIGGCFFTANVRSTPGVANALVGKIMVNSRVEILETRTYSGEQWGRTSIGWVNMNYVLLDGASPVV